jgi:hypothetical protein
LDLDLEIQIKNLLKGNKQKLGLVQALMHKPILLVMYEPTADWIPKCSKRFTGCGGKPRPEEPRFSSPRTSSMMWKAWQIRCDHQ